MQKNLLLGSSFRWCPQKPAEPGSELPECPGSGHVRGGDPSRLGQPWEGYLLMGAISTSSVNRSAFISLILHTRSFPLSLFMPFLGFWGFFFPSAFPGQHKFKGSQCITQDVHVALCRKQNHHGPKDSATCATLATCVPWGLGQGDSGAPRGCAGTAALPAAARVVRGISALRGCQLRAAGCRAVERYRRQVRAVRRRGGWSPGAASSGCVPQQGRTDG